MKRTSTPFESEKQTSIKPQPFLRWAGGKRRLTRLLIDSIPDSFNPSTSKYYEPFVGGGALLFALGDKNIELYVKGKNIYLNDANPELVVTYRTVKEDVDLLIKKLSKIASDSSKSNFEFIRKSKPRDRVGRAVRFIYLNKTCFNGLWRVNSRGEFNVPWGKLKNPNILDAELLRACSFRLKGSHITNYDFGKAVESARKGDLVYFDPPYLPLSNSANFSKYAKEDFSITDHVRLAKTIGKLTQRGVHVILSNSDTAASREIFGPVLNLRQIPMNRSISASAKSRMPVMEILGTSFPINRNKLLSKYKKIN